VDQKDLGYRLGAADVLLKPFDRDGLAGALARVAPQCRRILVVDDDPNVPELVRQWLAGEGCQIDWVADGAAALESLSGQRPNVILLDLLMPRMDGLALLDALSGDPQYRDIPVIVLTAKTLDKTERELLQERVLALIEKHGLDREALMREVRRVLPACAA
jgi:CheY-like chemotaxis protein